ncbi:MAG: ribbon-helix-helix domain-containing protein [Thalassobaculum sp.]
MGANLSASEDKSSILESRNVTVGGRRTSMRLEPQMWDAIETIAKLEGMSINRLCAEIDQRRRDVGLTSATRVFIISYYRQLVRSYEGQGLGPNGNGSLARIVLDSVVGKPIDRVTALRPMADRNLAVTGED